MTFHIPPILFDLGPASSPAIITKCSPKLKSPKVFLFSELNS
jgi:hypothetical protein